MPKFLDFKEMRDIGDALGEIVDNLDMCCTSSETISGYLKINERRVQITVKAETDEDKWVSD